jgi:hypothetical protein
VGGGGGSEDVGARWEMRSWARVRMSLVTVLGVWLRLTGQVRLVFRRRRCRAAHGRGGEGERRV